MSTIVYQDVQSCFEPQPTETTTLRLKLAAPKPIDIESTNTKRDDHCDQSANIELTKNSNLGCWNFLQSFSNSSLNKSLDSESFSPSLKLSQRSLDLCTEILGSETGSDDTCDANILSFDSTEAKNVTTRSKTRIQRHMSSAKKANTRSFPPPLTTISGSNSLQVRPHRQNGRLIIKAVEAPATRACFEAERSHGRLQLKFLKNCEFFYDSCLEVNDQVDNIEEPDTNKTEDLFKEENDADNNIVDEEEQVSYMKKEMNVNRKDVEVDLGREKFQRYNRRCKESGHGNNNRGLCNMEAFWVAT